MTWKHDDAARIVVVADHADVERLVGKADEHLGALRRGPALVRARLPEAFGSHGALPGRIAQHPAVQLWRDSNGVGLDDWRRGVHGAGQHQHATAQRVSRHPLTTLVPASPRMGRQSRGVATRIQ